ncbi:hypothetical protein [Desulfurobacterium crinifex]
MLHHVSRISLSALLLITAHCSLFTIPANSSAPPPIPALPLPSNNETEDSAEEKPIIEPPPSVKLNVPPPGNEEEAFKRIKDYRILINIIPPGTSQEQIKKQLFGEYKELVEPYLEEEENVEENNADNYYSKHRENTESRENFYRTERYTQDFEEKKPLKAIEHRQQIKSLDYSKENKTSLENKPEKNVKRSNNIYQGEKEEESSLPVLPIISFAIISAIALLFLKILKTFGGEK